MIWGDMKKELLLRDEIHFHPASYQDEVGRIFYWRGELYRGVTAPSAPFMAKLLQDEATQNLVRQKLLIETEITPFETDDFPMVLRHRRLSFVSYPFEWPGPMWQAGVLAIIEVAIALSRAGLMLKDAHLWNILFDGPRPIWIDLPSIVPRGGAAEWPAAIEFRDECLFPLILISQGCESLARCIVAQDDKSAQSELERLGSSGATGRGLASRPRHPWQRSRALLRQGLPRLPSLWRGEKTKPAAPQSFLSQLEQLKAEVESISLPGVEAAGSPPAAEPERDWHPKQVAVQKILSQTKPRTVLDLGSGGGWFCELAAHFAEEVVGFDIDPAAAAQLFRTAQDRNLPILSLVMDFARPTPASGLANHSHLSATERFSSEMVFMLGLLHELVFKYRRLGLNEIADGLALFSKRWVVVEFIPPDDPEIGSLRTDWFSGYTLENFRVALGRHFSTIESFPSSPAGRVLLFCER